MIDQYSKVGTLTTRLGEVGRSVGYSWETDGHERPVVVELLRRLDEISRWPSSARAMRAWHCHTVRE